ncbi:hypothetical protein RO3G_07140 [Rhizopus delemar RA 99-880]|uniref:Uncharacterized protein n=1 Tax=Rhizopus delemar (strain RA 99-880 / ATCC MYA-4621 / FGSC 9543 / NRRL 43880) TaxID=246409 RepID=I1C1V5_RHIO9|nr:hypothetical protein RO3G_07140 [Rhizopus delemar RA 99-880]|eukprot:EIE82435.1 hypothetical protein RO3G_07140 [Rhizopus delemar RA 99-880]
MKSIYQEAVSTIQATFTEQYACLCCNVYKEDLDELGEHLLSAHGRNENSRLEGVFAEAGIEDMKIYELSS